MFHLFAGDGYAPYQYIDLYENMSTVRTVARLMNEDCFQVYKTMDTGKLLYIAFAERTKGRVDWHDIYPEQTTS